MLNLEGNCEKVDRSDAFDRNLMVVTLFPSSIWLSSSQKLEKNYEIIYRYRTLRKGTKPTLNNQVNWQKGMKEQ